MLKVALLFSVSAAGMLMLPGAARAQGESCRRGDDVRVIEVLSPGTVGKACDVRVTRGGGAQVNTPYHANVDRNFCRAMAAELASRLTLDGFECSTAASVAVEASLAGGDEAPAAATDETSLAGLSLDQQADQLGLSGAAPAAGPPPAAAPAEPPALAMAPIADAAPEPKPAPQSAPVVDAAPSLDGIIAEEPAAPPVVLTEGASPAASRAPRPNKNGAGRIVGAQPSLEDIIDVSVAANEAAAPVLASANASANLSAGALPARTAENIVRGVLSANAAAWNEGNLTAYLDGYDQSGAVRLVNGADIVTGINSVRKHYQAFVEGAGAMGRLTFSDLDVTMTAPEVATVNGRYAHESGPAKTTGAMTMVMKQTDGRWRIVQDTRLKDAEVPTLAPVN